MSGATDQVPAGWASAKLGELGTWVGGGTPSKKVQAYWDGGTIPWVSPKDMKAVHLKDTEDHITLAAVKKSAVRLFPANSIAVVVRSGILARTLPIALIAVDATANQDMRVLIPDSSLNSEWVLWALIASSEDIRQKCQKDGTTVASIDVPSMERYAIGVPPRNEQNRIVAGIERMLGRVQTGEQKLADAVEALATFRASVVTSALRGDFLDARSVEEASDLLRYVLGRRSRALAQAGQKGRYSEPVEPRSLAGFELPEGWTWATVDQLATLVEYGSSAKTNAASDGVPVLRMGNIKDGRLALDELKYLPPDHDEFPRLFLREGDLLFNRTNSPDLVGKVAVTRDLPVPCSFASYLIRVRLADGVLPEWICYFLNSVYGRAWVKSVVTQQVGQANVNGSKLRAVTVPLPPKPTQRYLVDLVDGYVRSARELEATLAISRRDASNLTSSLLHYACGGRLDTTCPSDEPATVLLTRPNSARNCGDLSKRAHKPPRASLIGEKP